MLGLRAGGMMHCSPRFLPASWPVYRSSEQVTSKFFPSHPPWRRLTSHTLIIRHAYRPFPSPKSHFQNEVKCETFVVKMSFIYITIKNHFHINGFALSLALKVRFFGTRKWPVALEVAVSSHNSPCRDNVPRCSGNIILLNPKCFTYCMFCFQNDSMALPLY